MLSMGIPMGIGVVMWPIGATGGRRIVGMWYTSIGSQHAMLSVDIKKAIIPSFLSSHTQTG